MPNATGWTAIGGGASGLTAPETDYFIQGANCITKAAWAAALKGMIYDTGSGITVPTDGAVLMWINHLTPNSLAVKASGGLRVIIGSAATAYKHWYVDGSDKNVFGRWTLGAVDPAVTADATTGSPSATLQFFGGLANLPTGGPTKGSPFAIDAFRYGRGELRNEFGEAANYATFAGANGYGDDVTRRWGLLSFVDGAYYMSGLFVLGTATNAVDFRDSNRVIFIRDHDRVAANFNGIEVRKSTSNIAWTDISIQALGTVSKGRWVTTDNATIALVRCTFTDMGTFSFLTGLTATATTWRRCGQITAAGSILADCLITGYTGAADTSALVWNVATDPDGKLDDCEFVKGTTAHHAIEFGTSSPTTMTLRRLVSSGFNAANAQNDSFFHIKRTTGSVTISVVGGTGNFSYKTDGATVTIVLDPVTTLITTRDQKTNAVIASARVLVEAGDGAGDLPFQESVTITRSGTTASVAHTAHGLVSGDKVAIRGAVQTEYNGVFSISNVTANAYDYTVSGSPATPATGTITATGVVLEGLTNASGVISATRVFSVDQSVRGSARKSTTAPYYKSNDFTDVVDNVVGLSKTVALVRDD
jgi:hypothetical protein